MRGRKYRHWMSKRLPPRIEDPLAILDSVKAGERWAIEAMIEGHLRLAAGLVARYYKPRLSSRHADSDELVSAAFYAVANAVQRIADGHLTHDNPTAYIAVFIHGEIRRVLSNKSISVKAIQFNYHLDDISSTKKYFDKLAIVNVVGGYSDTTIDVEEAINVLVNDKTDARIVELLCLGYKSVEIADDLKIDKSNVSRRVNRIRKTFRELENE